MTKNKNSKPLDLEERLLKFLKINEIKLRSGATSLFDVRRWAFDVRCSSFKKTYQKHLESEIKLSC